MALDCSKATSELENIICKSDSLKQDEMQMEKAYFSLRKNLGPIGQKKLLTMQRAWLAFRSDMIVESAISEEIETHTQFLKNTPAGMVPFKRQTTLKKMERFLTGYNFPNPSTPVQRNFNKMLKPILNQTVGDPEYKGSEEVDASDIKRNDKFILSARIYSDGFYGGAHPLHSSVHINIDVKTGNPLKISHLFSKQAQRKIALACAVQLAQGRTAYEKDTALATFNAYQEDYPNQITNHIKDASRWQFEKTETTISFNEYAIAPYVAGEQRCSFENTYLAPLSKRPEFFK